MIGLHLFSLRVRCLLSRGHAWSDRCVPPSCARCGTTMRHWLIGELPEWMQT